MTSQGVLWTRYAMELRAATQPQKVMSRVEATGQKACGRIVLLRRLRMRCAFQFICVKVQLDNRGTVEGPQALKKQASLNLRLNHLIRLAASSLFYFRRTTKKINFPSSGILVASINLLNFVHALRPPKRKKRERQAKAHNYTLQGSRGSKKKKILQYLTKPDEY